MKSRSAGIEPRERASVSVVKDALYVAPAEVSRRIRKHKAETDAAETSRSPQSARRTAEQYSDRGRAVARLIDPRRRAVKVCYAAFFGATRSSALSSTGSAAGGGWPNSTSG